MPAQIIAVPDECDFSTPCEFSIGERSLIFRVAGRVTPLGRFTIEVEGQGLQAISIRFQMIGMNMGVNRYPLEQEHSALWRTEVMLPVCASGRRDWIASYDIQWLGSSRLYRVEYPFSTGSS